MQKPINLIFILIIPALLLITGCAHPVSPQGGLKDVKPPEVTGCDPPNLSILFKEQGFTVDFNEFVILKNQANEIFISPPLGAPPETRVRGKSLIIKFEKPLLPNTTYSVYFGNAIADLTEGNILTGFKYVFSTGGYIDSLALKGNLVNAFDHKPQKNVFIELYADNNDTIVFDSLPFRVPPYYITKTDEQGNFIFTNLKPGQYKLFALADQNSDLIFNQPSEKIAFADSLVRPYVILPSTLDSLGKDTSHTEYPVHTLLLFEEIDSVQRLLKTVVQPEGMALLQFRFPVKELQIVPLNFDSTAPWCLQEFSMKRDSVRLWVTLPGTDTVNAKILVDNKVFDTVKFEFPLAADRSKSLKKEKPPRLNIIHSARSPGLNQFRQQLIITFSAPISKWDFSKLILANEKDTLHPEIKFPDSIRRTMIIKNKWEEEKTYRIMIPDSVFYDINDLTHDTVRMEFRTRAEREFGNLSVAFNPKDSTGQYIVQLYNEKEVILFEEVVVTGKRKLTFDFLSPGRYRIKAITDRNLNRRWDTGNARINLQPEEVSYYDKIIEVRANWDVEETWNQ